MAQTRIALSKALRLAFPEIRNFYFSPPNGTQMKYPCVVYRFADNAYRFADNIPFVKHKQYTVTIIDENPDSPYSDRFIEYFDYASLDRAFSSDNLNHFVHTLFY